MEIPGMQYGGYFKLKEIIEKGKLESKKIVIEYKNNQIYVNGKILQGLVVVDKYAQITGIHYTSWENATQIRSMQRIEPSLDDPFVYVSEPGKMQGWPEEQIKKELGAGSADTEVKLVILVLLDKVWIKVSRNVAHYALTGILNENEIKNLEIHRIKAR